MKPAQARKKKRRDKSDTDRACAILEGRIRLALRRMYSEDRVERDVYSGSRLMDLHLTANKINALNLKKLGG